MEVPQGSGSGFVWDTDGHVVTNYHVIAKAQTATVTLGAQGASYQAKLIGAEPEYDIAVLKIDAPSSSSAPLVPVKLASSADLLVGQSVAAIGNPFGLDHTLTTGIVSALGREVQGVGGRPIKGCVQTDAAINPGNSGGPLLDSGGRLIGVNTMIYSPSGASAGIGFAIPVDTVRRVVSGIVRYGSLQAARPTLGITIADEQTSRSVARQLGMSRSGVLVIEAPDGSPGASVGMRGTQRMADGRMSLGDMIVGIDGISVQSGEDLLAHLESRQVGDVAELTLLRGLGGRAPQEQKLKLRLGKRR